MSNIIYENDRLVICSEVISGKSCAVLRLKENNEVIETYSDVYPETLYIGKIIVRSSIPPFLSGILDLNTVKTKGGLTYPIGCNYFKILFWEKIGYLLIHSPNDCRLVDFDFNPLFFNERFKKIIKSESGDTITFTSFDNEITEVHLD